MMSNPTLHVLRLKNVSILEQLRLEEALLRTDSRNWCILNEGAAPAIVMGISGKFDLLINKSRLEQKPVPVIRRFSGGGTVFINPDTLFSTFICNSHDLGVPCYPHAVFDWTRDIYHPIFADLNFNLLENDYVIDNKKFGGNAQYMRKERWLHHSSLLWDYDPDQMDYLLLPEKAPAYRQKRNHSDFLCRLGDYFPAREQFFQRFYAILERKFSIQEGNHSEVLELQNRPHRQATALLF